MDREKLQMQAAFIASGAILSHGARIEETARIAIALAREINRQLDLLDEEPPDQAPTPTVDPPDTQAAG